MRFGDWLRHLFGVRRPATEMVPFLDVSGRIVQVPLSHLRPGMVRAQYGDKGIVWAWPNQFKASEVRHPPFDEAVRAYIRDIQETFAEQRPLSFEEWEDGFRRDAKPEEEIAMWSHAADVYRAFTDNEISPERRRDIYQVIVNCLIASPDTIWRVLKLQVLSHAEAEEVVNRVYGGR